MQRAHPPYENYDATALEFVGQEPVLWAPDWPLSHRTLPWTKVIALTRVHSIFGPYSSREHGMSKLRRYHTPGNWYFITSVTYLRRSLLVTQSDLLLSAFERARANAAHDLQAWVILPDHFHVVIDSKTGDISGIMQRIKMGFGARWRRRTGQLRGRVWQNRFWDHIIRDQDDLNRKIDYIHYNPVKHGFVKSPFDWPHSSIHQYHREGIYDRNWGLCAMPELEGQFGE